MPPRFPSFPISARLQHQRFFSHTRSAKQEGGGKTHYETLGISIDATPAEVKKQFYTLSKTHHPDLNPHDPTSSQRFIKINEAYATLSIPASRRAYDLSLPSSPNSSPSHSSSSRRTGSYASTNPAGGRPASGLSRRQTQFRGAPESFYAHGGWGAQTRKRGEAQGGGSASDGGTSSSDGKGGEGWGGEGGGERMNWKEGGMGHGQMGWGHGGEVPHFDKEGHFRSQESYEAWRRRRGEGSGENQREREQGESRGGGMLGQFLFVGGIVTLGVWVPGVVFERVSAGGKGKVDGERKEK